ncbi:MAG: aspartate--tRNA(Asn) ligase [Candidatus Aenigmarchaeota archaeon]|nr:aspartate--tRNA(Asn) ligase [Candidatus Aenigmarchaeota archaeon]
MDRVYAGEVKENAGKEVTVYGWVDAIRALGKITFVVIRDRSGKVQTIARKDTPAFDQIKDLSREYVIEARGLVKESKSAPGGSEIELSEVKTISKAEPLPIEFSGKIDTNMSKRLDYRYIDLRNPQTKEIFLIKSEITNRFRKFLHKKGFVEIHTPKIVKLGAEGGSEMFPILYYNQEGYLAQSPQLYKQMMQAAGFEKVFEIGPVYRAEKSHTIRHISEYWGLDCEMSFIKSFEEVMDTAEAVIKYTLEKLEEDHKDIIESFGVTMPNYKEPFPRLTLQECFELIGRSVEDPTAEEEKLIGSKVLEKLGSDFVFIKNYPFSARPFYTMKNANDPALTDSFDLVFRGLEIISGGQREHRLEVLLAQAKEKNISVESLSSYIESFRYGMPPHGGFGLGIERLVMQLLGLENIREAVLFPRDTERLTP